MCVCGGDGEKELRLLFIGVLGVKLCLICVENLQFFFLGGKANLQQALPWREISISQKKAG